MSTEHSSPTTSPIVLHFGRTLRRMSDTGFTLPNGAERSPDLAWVRRERWDALAPEEREEFPPVAPDFVVELRSKVDSAKKLRAKMQEYIDCGTQLGWLIDPVRRRVVVFRSDQEPETLERPATVNGDPILPGFVLKLATIWS